MKKNSLILGAAALMLATACSNDEVVKVAENGAAIGFSSFVNNSTRADASTYDNINDLKVWGVTSRGTEVAATEIFGGQLVEKNGAASGSGVWTYTPLRYWIAGNDYSFAAVAPATIDELTVDQSLADGWTEAGLTLTFDNKAAKAEKDILYAAAGVESAAANNAAVNLNLKHMLSRVKFQFENGLGNDMTIAISGLQINNAVAKATITKAAATDKWTAAGTETFEVPFTAYAESNKNVNTEFMYLIPTTTDINYNITFTVSLKQGDNVIATYKHENVALGSLGYTKNYSYNFKTKIDNTNIDPTQELKPIEFTATVDAWQDVKDETNKDYNLK